MHKVNLEGGDFVWAYIISFFAIDNIYFCLESSVDMPSSDGNRFIWDRPGCGLLIGREHDFREGTGLLYLAVHLFLGEVFFGTLLGDFLGVFV